MADLLTYQSGPLPAGIVLVVIVFLMALNFFTNYRKAGPNEALIISGRKRRHRFADAHTAELGFRVVTGGGSFVYPIFEKVDSLSLEIQTVEVDMVGVDGVAQVKIGGDEDSIVAAAERFVGKGVDEIARVAGRTLEGHMRAVLDGMAAEDVHKNREAFVRRVRESAAEDLGGMGLRVEAFSIMNIKKGEVGA